MVKHAGRLAAGDPRIHDRIDPPDLMKAILAKCWLTALCLSQAIGLHANDQTDPLPSWNVGPAKQSIVDFVAKVTKEGGPDFVLPAERIAAFDNDLGEPQHG